MIATLKEIMPSRFSRNRDTEYVRLKLVLADGTFAMTDLVSTFRNFRRWLPIIESGVGTKIAGVSLMGPNKVDADSPVSIQERPAPDLKQAPLKL